MTRSVLCVVAALAAVALLSTPTLAITEILYSFEDATNQGFTSSDNPGAHTAVTTTGVTDGSYSLRVTGDQGNDQGGGFQRNTQVTLGASELAALNTAAAAGGSISFDLTIDRAEYHPDISFFKAQFVLNTDAAGGGWTQRDLMEGNPLPPNTQDPVFDPNGPRVQTYHFDIPFEVLNPAGDRITGSNGAAEIRVATNTWDNLQPPVGITERVIYLDNFAVNYVPEPAAMTAAAGLLLGMTMVRRRRR